MDYENFCERCQHYEFDLGRGILCGLTHDKPSFENDCKDFVLAEGEKQSSHGRAAKLLKDAATILKIRLPNFRVFPKKHFTFVTIFGQALGSLLILLSLWIWFGEGEFSTFWFIAGIVIIAWPTLKQIKSTRDNAALVTTQARSIISTSIQIEERNPVLLENTKSILRHAEQEFHENAYGPFWDAVEQAAINLNVFNDNVKNLSTGVEKYYSILSGRQHTFPQLDFNNENLMVTESIMKEFQRIVRLGETNPHFAMIWEQRKTRQVLIAGFSNLGKAVANLETTIRQSMAELNQSISAGLATIAAQQERMIRAQRGIGRIIRQESAATRSSLKSTAHDTQKTHQREGFLTRWTFKEYS